MWAEVNGERKKVACCERIVINYTIPKSSECACPSERASPATAPVAGNSRIEKNRRKSTAINPLSLERAMKASQDTETDTSSLTQTPTDMSNSIEASPPSSASSTPRLLPAQKESVSSCCKPKPVQQPVAKGGCCGSKPKQQPAPAPVKSCCGGSKSQANVAVTGQPSSTQQFGQQFQFQLQPQFQNPQFQGFPQQTSAQPSYPFGLGAPIYNHAAAAYQQPPSMSMSPTIHGPILQLVPEQHMGQHAPEHNCHCGESCSCFGCAAHPNNATMMEYVRLMAQFQYTGGFGTMAPPLYDVPAYPHQARIGAKAGQPMAFNQLPQNLQAPFSAQMAFQASMNLSTISSAPLPVSEPWQQSSISTISAPETQFLHANTSNRIPASANAQLVLKAEESLATPVAKSSNDGNEEETDTLSPSSFFWNQMVLPSCSDATGTCQCGDGCECVGCLTHGGHNGVPLETSAINEHDAFPDFIAHGNLNLDDSTHFLNFNTAPT
ncbi:hypothetical protein P153DRAFT_296908 [Dothidotthia symphoricarpi CBS 119687]|uniref:Copper-fist domain-containing protein n=1 Tax=Dothidotthia symphoricarpi CBS 119687 TaxID=1392245 RepID=A0A6A6A7S6_9PLEO|nr:uncharacterized protein P153DRAFT_296908 [Dothidotthia symphoricarpi CBS 119687]KAF2126848.1 hypothetical protein P153DRAFT_296908 [Dothidotthia symphoricarpi CBS 119687]